MPKKNDAQSGQKTDDGVAISPGRPDPLRQRGEQGRSVTTRADLIAAARDLFATIGYHAAGTPDIVARAQVTRGALYHHFGGKEGLFVEVFRQVSHDLLQEAQAATRPLQGQTTERITATLGIYLELLAFRPHYQRILLIDGPAVVGWERWRELRGEYDHPAWVGTLSMLKEKGVNISAPIDTLAHLIMAAIADVALAVAHADNQQKALKDGTAAIAFLLTGLGVRAG